MQYFTRKRKTLMKKSKKILTLTIAIVLALTCVFSLSSCLNALYYILESAPSADGGSGSQNQGNLNGNHDSGAGSSSGNNNQSGTPETEFLPGSENSDTLIDSVDARFKTLLSSVVIVTKFEVYVGSLNGYGSYDRTTTKTSGGSGVIYSVDRESGDAYIITNFHVIYSDDAVTQDKISNDISIYLYGQESSSYAMKASYVGGSLEYDIAVLKIEGSEVIRHSLATAATFADSDKVAVLDECIVVGNADGDGMSVTTGIVSVDSEQLSLVGADLKTNITLRVMRVSAAVNHGNSGGGLYDENGKLIGVVVAKKTGEEVDNMGYAIPSNLAKSLVENIIANCDGETNTSLRRALLGITLTAYTSGLAVDDESGKLLIHELVEIIEFTDDCLVSDVLAVGDIITSVTVDGVTKNVTRTHHVIDLMLTARAGSTVSITVDRNGESITATVTIPETAITKVK